MSHLAEIRRLLLESLDRWLTEQLAMARDGYLGPWDEMVYQHLPANPKPKKSAK